MSFLVRQMYSLELNILINSIECCSPNWGRPLKTYATEYYEEVSVLYLLFLEYRIFLDEIGKPLHLEYFLQATMCIVQPRYCLCVKIHTKKAFRSKSVDESELTGGRWRWLDYEGDADTNFLPFDKKVRPGDHGMRHKPEKQHNRHEKFKKYSYWHFLRKKSFHRSPGLIWCPLIGITLAMHLLLSYWPLNPEPDPHCCRPTTCSATSLARRRRRWRGPKASPPGVPPSWPTSPASKPNYPTFRWYLPKPRPL